MLTTAQLALLIRYRWDARLFAARAPLPEQHLMQPVDWDAAGELLQDLIRYHRQLLAPAYAARLSDTLRRFCADEATIHTLLGYASTLA